MKNKFKDTDIGKTVKFKCKTNEEWNEFRGVFIGFSGTTNGVPRPDILVYGKFIGRKETVYPILLSLQSIEYKNISNSKISKKISDEAKNIIKRINNTLKEYKKKLQTSDYLVNKFHNNLDKLTKKYKSKQQGYLLDVINKLFDDTFPSMRMGYFNEDYDEEDMDEYNVIDIEDTKHVSLQLEENSYASITIMEYFDLDSIIFGSKEIEKINLVYPTFTREDGNELCRLIRHIVKTTNYIKEGKIENNRN